MEGDDSAHLGFMASSSSTERDNSKGRAMGDAVRLNAYFERIGFAGSIAPTLATLEALHALQPAAIPFENLDTLLGRPAALDQASLETKLLDERRGGICVELNLLLLRILLELGFEARAHLATVLLGASGEASGRPDHVLLSVDISGTTWLADVGFGGRLQAAPLKLRPDAEQPTPQGAYRILAEGPAFRLDFQRGETWSPAYAFTFDPADDGVIADALALGPHSVLKEHLLVERLSGSTRSRLFDTRLAFEGEGGREERQLASVAEIRDMLALSFGIALPTAEGLDAALANLVARNAMAG
jgi:N-hydroxyarylamine O-acetyltransferase